MTSESITTHYTFKREKKRGRERKEKEMHQFTYEEIILLLFTIDTKIKEIDQLINDLKKVESEKPDEFYAIKYWQNEQKSLMRLVNKIKSL